MDYLKFAGLCLLAGIVFRGVNILVQVLPGPMLPLEIAGVGFALLITGAGFAFIRPAHFKFGYAVWIVISIISYYGTQWLGQMAVSAPTGNPHADLAYDLGWLVGCVLSNPVCYLLGKRLHFRVTRKRALLSLAEHFD